MGDANGYDGSRQVRARQVRVCVYDLATPPTFNSPPSIPRRCVELARRLISIEQNAVPPRGIDPTRHWEQTGEGRRRVAQLRSIADLMHNFDEGGEERGEGREGGRASEPDKGPGRARQECRAQPSAQHRHTPLKTYGRFAMRDSGGGDTATRASGGAKGDGWLPGLAAGGDKPFHRGHGKSKAAQQADAYGSMQQRGRLPPASSDGANPGPAGAKRQDGWDHLWMHRRPGPR